MRSPTMGAMPRAPFQVLVYPFRRATGALEYLLLRRSHAGWWHGVAGGGEEDESPEEGARRAAFEVAGVPASATFHRLETMSMIPRTEIQTHARSHWPPSV
ncbi:MAG: NUDIX domain-containing protein [Candidatus Dormibacteraceae bacterium]